MLENNKIIFNSFSTLCIMEMLHKGSQDKMSHFLKSPHNKFPLSLCLKCLLASYYSYIYSSFFAVVFLEVLARAFSVGEIITHGRDLHFLMNNIDRWRTTVSSLCMVRSEWVREGWGRGERISIWSWCVSVSERFTCFARTFCTFTCTRLTPVLCLRHPLYCLCTPRVMCVWCLHVWHVYAHVMDVLPGTRHSEEACRPLLVLNAIRLNNDVT